MRKITPGRATDSREAVPIRCNGERARRLFRMRFCTVAIAFLLPAQAGSAAPSQEPASPGQMAAAEPAAALRDLLSAACLQDQKEFGRFFTERNARAYAGLSANSRIALMKRFVLLDEPGKPSVSVNPSGRATVACETPAVTTEMQIGGADKEENVAFVPLEIRATGRAARAEARQIQIGLVREGDGWKLLSAGLLLLDLPTLEIEWDRANLDGNEKEAVETLKRLAEALETYRRTYARLPESLAQLGPPARGAATADAAGLIDADLAAGVKSGYTFRYVIVGANAVGAPAKYELAATPRHYGASGRRSFFRAADGTLHRADRRGGLASDADPRIEQSSREN